MAEQRKDKKGRILRSGEYYNASTGIYQYRKMIDGKRTTISDTDLVNLRKRAADLNVALERGQDVQSSYQTLNNLFDEWCKNYAMLIMKPGTLTNYKSYYETYVRDGLGKKKIGKISYNDCVQLFKELVANDLSKSTQGNLKSLLNHLFEYAIDNDAILKNPCKNIKIVGADKKQRNNVSDTQVSMFMSYIKDKPQYAHVYPLFSILFNTGMRIGEAAALQWSDIDFKNETITVNKTVNRVREKEYGFTQALGTPKSNASIRTIWMSDETKSILLMLWQNRKKCGVKIPFLSDRGTIKKYYSDFVFINSNGNIWTEPIVRATIKRIVDKQNKGVEKPEEKLVYFCPHMTRHTFTTVAYAQNVDMKQVSNMLGHASVKVTMDTYTHLSEDKEKEQKELVKKIRVS